jgi:hypothetical protein
LVILRLESGNIEEKGWDWWVWVMVRGFGWDVGALERERSVRSRVKGNWKIIGKCWVEFFMMRKCVVMWLENRFNIWVNLNNVIIMHLELVFHFPNYLLFQCIHSAISFIELALYILLMCIKTVFQISYAFFKVRIFLS